MNNMKISHLPLLFLFFVGTVSCYPDTAEVVTYRLDGAWQLESATGSGQNVTHYDGSEYPATFSMRTVTPTDYVLTFTPQGRVYSTGTFTEEVTGTFQGRTSTRTVDNANILGAGVWKLEGSRLQLGSDSPEEMQMKIITLTDTDLVLEYTNSFSTTKNGNRVEEQQRVTYVLVRSAS